MRHPMKLKDIRIRTLDERECGLHTQGMNYAVEYHRFVIYYSDKPTKHQARYDLYKYITHNYSRKYFVRIG